MILFSKLNDKIIREIIILIISVELNFKASHKLAGLIIKPDSIPNLIAMRFFVPALLRRSKTKKQENENKKLASLRAEQEQHSEGTIILH